MNSIDLNQKNLKFMDIVCLATDPDYIHYDMIRKFSKIIIDCRGKFKKNSKKIIRA